MMESESIALPLGDTPTVYSVLSTIFILAFFTGFVKKIFPIFFKKILPKQKAAGTPGITPTLPH